MNPASVSLGRVVYAAIFAALCTSSFGQVPSITGFSPASGPVKRNVTVTGTNFSGSGISFRGVLLNGQGPTNTSVSANRIVFTVSPTESSGPITVMTSLGNVTTTSNFTVTSGPAPANDSFATPQLLVGPSGAFSGNTANATKEPGEPNHAGDAGGASVWFAWNAPTSGWYVFNPYDGTRTNFGVNLAVYTGSSVDALAPIASGVSGNPFARYLNALSFNATAGVTYLIAIDGYTGNMGDFYLTWNPLGPPTISSVSPVIGAYAGQLVSISGSGFVPGTAVSIGGVSVDSSLVSPGSANSLTVSRLPVTVPVGIQPVVITTPVGTATSSLTVLAPPPPAITSFSPSAAAAGARVTFAGSALWLGDGATRVSFNGVYANSLSFTSGTSMSAIVPSGAITGPITIQTVAGSFTTPSNFTVTSSYQPPTLSMFSPTSGAAGTTVSIFGQNFAGATGVSFNGLSATFTVDPYGQLITATVPAGAMTGPITVNNPAGSATSSTSFTIIPPPPPIITSFTPATITDGTVVMITGTDFGGATAVSFNGVAAASFTVDSPTQITAIVPSGPLSNGPISVTTAFGVGTSSESFTYLAPVVGPTITSFSPTAIAPGLPVMITGTNFTNIIGVYFNDVPAGFAVVSSTQINATAPLTLSVGLIKIITAAGVGISPTGYTITQLPIISAITPPFGPQKRVITVSGANLYGTGIGTPTVKVNGTPIGAFSVSSTGITFAVPVGATTGRITATTQQGTATSPYDFVVQTGPPPANDNFANAQPLAGSSGIFSGNTANATKEPGEPNHSGNSGGASVWFTWTAPQDGLFLFNPANSVGSQFGIIQAIYTGDSVGALNQVASGLTPTNVFTRYNAAAVLNATAGTTYRIALDGYTGVMADYRLTWSPLMPPVVTSFSPSGAMAGQTVTVSIYGSNFTPGATVSFGGGLAAAAKISYQSATLITVSQVPITAISGPITVTTPAGSASSSASFLVTPPPAPSVTGLTPTSALVGSSVTISGTNFVGASAVVFGGQAAATFTVDAAGQTITAVVPPDAVSGPITVTTPGGTAVSTPFVVIGAPVIAQSPESQVTVAGTSVTLSVAVTSNAPVTYTWRKDGVPLTGNASAQSPTLVIPIAWVIDSGSYDCEVANIAGSVTSRPATLVVNQAITVVTLSNLSAVYDGSSKNVTPTTDPAVRTVRITYDGSVTAPINAGSYAVEATVDDPNYMGSTTGTLVINPAVAHVALANLAGTYDGLPHGVVVATEPVGLRVNVSYGGLTGAPINAGSYTVNATVIDRNYSGSATGTLVIAKQEVAVTLGSLNQRYNGQPRIVTTSTLPAAGAVHVTYNGADTPPTSPGKYGVVATVDDQNRDGSANGTLVITITALVRHLSPIDGGIAGSLQAVTSGDIMLNGGSYVSGDLLVPGTPVLQINGHPTIGGIRDAGGAASPSDYQVTLNGAAVLRYLVRRADPIAMPIVEAPPAPTGTRDFVVTKAAQVPMDFGSVRNLSLSGNAGQVSIPAGTYGDLTVTGQNGFIIGVVGASTPSIYNVQSLTVATAARLVVLGPVVVNIANRASVSGQAGDFARPEWLQLQVAGADVTIAGNGGIAGDVVAPEALVTVAGNGTIHGSVTANQLSLGGNALLSDPE
jgi:hypothetical protein